MDNPEDRQLDEILESQLFKCSICGQVKETKDRAYDMVCYYCVDKDERIGEE